MICASRQARLVIKPGREDLKRSPATIGCLASGQNASAGELRSGEVACETRVKEAVDLARAFLRADLPGRPSLQDKIADLDTAMLRELQEAMVTLSGQRARAAEPPVPPPPEPLYFL